MKRFTRVCEALVLTVIVALAACSAKITDTREPKPSTAAKQPAEGAPAKQPVGRANAKQPNKEKLEQLQVDCNRMCTRTFNECVGEVLVASGKMDSKKIDLIKKAGAFKKVQDAGYGACMNDCDRKKGFGSDAGKINKCLEKKDCKSYADCIKAVIK
ncbi:MAG: hypothetical protein ABI333_29450 [bacterium]